MKTLTITSCFIIITTGLVAQQSEKKELSRIDFYNGDVIIESIEGRIIIDERGIPDVKANVNLLNKSNRNEDISFGFRGGDLKKLTLVGKQIGKEIFSPRYEVSGQNQSSKNVKIDLAPLINGSTPEETIGNVNLTIELPQNVRIIRSNKPLQKSQEGNKTVYLFRETKKYLTPLLLVYNIDGIAVDIVKEIYPAKIIKGPVDVSIKVTNNGTEEIKDILIEDNFDPRDFSASGSEFFSYQGEQNDRRIIWKKNISSLQPGETVVLSYKVSSKFEVKNISLSAAKATINGNLIGVSNKVRL